MCISVWGTDERCPFLNGQNLCDLYIALGPEHLCAICREHPRFYSWWGSFAEAGLGLCCEEACRLLLADERPLTFVESENDAPDEACELSKDELSFLLEARGKLFSVLQDRSLPIEARLRRCLTLSQQMQDEWDGFPPLTTLKKRICPMQTPYSPSPRSLNPLTKAGRSCCTAPNAAANPLYCRITSSSTQLFICSTAGSCSLRGRRSDERYAC